MKWNEESPGRDEMPSETCRYMQVVCKFYRKKIKNTDSFTCGDCHVDQLFSIGLLLVKGTVRLQTWQCLVLQFSYDLKATLYLSHN